MFHCMTSTNLRKTSRKVGVICSGASFALIGFTVGLPYYTIPIPFIIGFLIGEVIYTHNKTVN